MKIGINLWNWTKDPCEDIPSLIQHVSNLGFEAVELPLNRPQDWNLSQISSSLSRCGLELTLCAQLSHGLDGSSPDTEVRSRTIKYLKDGLEIGSLLGAKVLVGPLYGGSGKRNFLTPEEKKDEVVRAADTLRSLCYVAEQAGVNLAIEPINRYRTSVINTVEQALELTKLVDSPALGVHFDTYQANIEENDPYAALQASLEAGKLYHFHACENQRSAPGTGHINWKMYTEILKRHEYQGHLTMEMFTIGGLDSGFIDNGSPDDLAVFGHHYLSDLLRDLA
ncbi:MAG: sugar phosphate isomerase/epimerase family protein [Anaerolineaceae bacterium]|nr:sugar phosphate isomerase/epimerase family protein [Anaerolineaceae bacterium]